MMPVFSPGPGRHASGCFKCAVSVDAYVSERTSLLLSAVDQSLKNVPGNPIERSLDDFQRLNRSFKAEQASLGSSLPADSPLYIPLRSLKTILSGPSWVRNGEGWHPSKSRSVRRIEEWINACLPAMSDQAQREFLDDFTLSQLRLAQQHRRHLEAVPKQLQQFFASERNRERVIELALEGYERINGGNAHHRNNRILAIEPSCGDGRILRHLIEAVKFSHTKGSTPAGTADTSGVDLSVVGCDIDGTMIEHTQSWLLDEYPSVESAVICGDFLTMDTMTVDQLLLLQQERKQGGAFRGNTSKVAEVESSSDGVKLSVDRTASVANTISSDCVVENKKGSVYRVVLGGPPYKQYTAVGGATTEPDRMISYAAEENKTNSNSSSSTQQSLRSTGSTKAGVGAGGDYALQFLAHSALRMNADRIVFILPERCSHPGFLERASKAMNGVPPRTAMEPSSDLNEEGIKMAGNRENVYVNNDGSSMSVAESADDSGGAHTDTAPVELLWKSANENFVLAADKDVSFQSSNGFVGKCCTQDFKWKLLVSEEADNIFDFVGRQIKQPAVIQAWERKCR